MTGENGRHSVELNKKGVLLRYRWLGRSKFIPYNHINEVVTAFRHPTIRNFFPLYNERKKIRIDVSPFLSIPTFVSYSDSIRIFSSFEGTKQSIGLPTELEDVFLERLKELNLQSAKMTEVNMTRD